MKEYSYEIDEKAIVSRLYGRNKVLSTSVLNGGIHTDINAVFNLDCKPEPGEDIILMGGTYESHLKWYSETVLGVPWENATGMMTAAQMANAAECELSFGEELKVMAVVTGGIDKNGSAAGEDAHWHENNGVWFATDGDESESHVKPGTINILLFISADLTDGALTRAAVTATEAKTSVIQELSLPSMYSQSIATGSGTDGIIIICDMDSPLVLTEAGKHTKLGELIGKTVKKAVREALFRQTGAGPENQSNVFARIGRFGVKKEGVLQTVIQNNKQLCSYNNQETHDMLDKWAQKPENVTWAILTAKLMDEYANGMIQENIFLASLQRVFECFCDESDFFAKTVFEMVVLARKK